MKAEQNSSVDAAEVARFSAIADEWWDPSGKFRPLHKFNPVRLRYIKEIVCQHFDREFSDRGALTGMRLLDIGCGGGLLSEPMARLGADVVGADPSETNIVVAKLHAERTGLKIDYRAETAEQLQERGETFDIILNMEVVEHVADVELFLKSCCRMVKPGGLMFVATINRTPAAYALAIVGAERVLGWLPKGTHSYDKLVQPQEIERPLADQGLYILDRTGVFYNPLADAWVRSRSLEVNYMMVCARN